MLDRLRASVLDTSTQLKLYALKITTAESCTGGGLSYWLTSVPGSSAWIDRGFVTYSNEAKTDMLGVPAETIITHGAVSQATAIAMASGALIHSQANLAISITGIAGPDGGSIEKPVGTVWIGWAGRNISIHPSEISAKTGASDNGLITADAALYTFEGDRQSIRIEAMIAALEKIKSLII